MTKPEPYSDEEWAAVVDALRSDIESGWSAWYVGDQNLPIHTDRILATIESLNAPAPAWQPIETAPDDETEVLVCTCHKEVLLARFVAGEWWVPDVPRPWVVGALTHWMPLPEPPHLALNEA